LIWRRKNVHACHFRGSVADRLPKSRRADYERNGAVLKSINLKRE